MEELNKNQIVLLVLFVSFVTSIATGIVTVTLMSQSPKGVTQNISNVVERSIERIVPSGMMTGGAKSEVVPVMVTEEESVIKVINGATPAVVKISRLEAGALVNVGTGFLVGNQINVVAPSAVVTDKNASYFALFSSGQKASLRLAAGDASSTLLALFRVQSVEEKKDLLSNPFKKDTKDTTEPLQPIKFAASETTLGQTVIAIADTNAVSVGIVSGFAQDQASSTLKLFRTNAANADNVGGPILNIRGEVVGMSSAQGLALPSGLIKAFVDSVK